MILYLPYKFDANEWFVLIGMLINLIAMFILPKKFPASVTIIILLFGIAAAKNADFIFGPKPYDLYDINDYPELELSDLVLSFLYAPFGYYFLYIYETWKFTRVKVSIYILLFALFGVGFEYIAYLAHVFTYKGWKIYYSFPVYLITLSGALIFYRLVKASIEMKSVHIKK